MSDEVQVERDADRAAHAVAATWPQWLSKLTGCIELHRSEFDPHPILQLLDQFGFTDYFGVTAQKTLRRIAMRAQFRPLLFASHTIREERPGGAKTELPKLLEALREDPGELPSLHVQIYCNADGSEAIGGGSVRSVEFTEWLSGTWERLDARYSPEKFRIAWWRQMRGDGLEVRAFGESRLKSRIGPAAGPFEYFSRPVISGPCPRCGQATAIGFKGDRVFPVPTLCTSCQADDIAAAVPEVGEWNRAVHERVRANSYQHQLVRQWADKARQHI